VGAHAMPASERPGPGALFTFVVGVVMCYAVMQNRIRLLFPNTCFFVHRGQHFGPAFTWARFDRVVQPLYDNAFLGAVKFPRVRRPWLATVQLSYRVLQNPVVAPVFVSWAWFISRLSPEHPLRRHAQRQLYWIMNWACLLDGSAFWWADIRSPFPLI